ncbi:Lipoprotein NlpI precursor [Gimesia algae]|uniref:Lipoprotein NlpI n=2 Tax=Gimesia algae TaxID=2527971 RepID=A0A517V8Z1_9PLAN|nr:Lipoprotein NlpI precursor [Gimesia algae]
MYFCNIPKLSRTLFFGLVTIFFIFPSSLYAEDWIGKKFMPNADIKYFKTSKAVEEVPAESIEFPLTVTQTDKEHLKVSGGWVKKTHVIPLDEAIDYYSDYLKTKNPFSSWAYTNRAISWHEKNENSKAINDFIWATRFDSKNAIAYHYEGVTWLVRRENDTAVDRFDNAAKFFPDNPKTYFYRGVAKYERGTYYRPAYDLALKDFDKSIALAPDFPEAYQKRGDTYFQLEKFEQALKDYDTAVRLNPNSHIAYFNRGLAWTRKGKPQKAIKDFDAAIRLNAEFWLAYQSRGYAWNALGEYEKAIKEFNALIKQDPDYFFYIIDRAYCHSSKGKYDLAIQDYQEVIHQRPDSPHGHNGVSWIRSTCPDPQYRDGNAAVESGKKACELSRWRNPEYLDTLAAAYAENNDFEQSIKYQKRAIQLSDGDSSREEFESRLKLYQAGKPYHQTPAEIQLPKPE